MAWGQEQKVEQSMGRNGLCVTVSGWGWGFVARLAECLFHTHEEGKAQSTSLRRLRE